MADDAEKLQSIFAALSVNDQASLLAFAEFLYQRQSSSPASFLAMQPAEPPVREKPRPLEPDPIARPESESVIKAVKRLGATYHMLDKNALLGETSDLVTQHVVMGRDRTEVIDTLESIFERRYQEYLAQFETDGDD